MNMFKHAVFCDRSSDAVVLKTNMEKTISFGLRFKYILLGKVVLPLNRTINTYILLLLATTCQWWLSKKKKINLIHVSRKPYETHAPSCYTALTTANSLTRTMNPEQRC